MKNHVLTISIDVSARFDGQPDGALLEDVKRRLEADLHDLVHKHFVGKAEVTGYNAVFEWDETDDA